MSNGRVQIWISPNLKKILEDTQLSVANEIKKTYGLETVTISNTMASDIIASKLKGENKLKFKIEKVSLNHGVIILL